MSEKEEKRAQILDLLKGHQISQHDAAKRLGITTRQVRRLSKRYQAAGLAGSLELPFRWDACSYGILFVCFVLLEGLRSLPSFFPTGWSSVQDLRPIP